MQPFLELVSERTPDHLFVLKAYTNKCFVSVVLHLQIVNKISILLDVKKKFCFKGMWIPL